MTRAIERVLAYGCSWTAGDELMDHVHMGISFDRCNTIKKMFIATGRTHENLTRFNDKYGLNTPEVIELNKRNSWAGQLAALLGKPFENRAVGGSSMDTIYFKIYNDYHAGKILPTDLVLVGLTTMARTIRFNKILVLSLQLGYHATYENIEDRSLIELFNDDYLVFNYSKTLLNLAALKSRMNIRLQPVLKETNPFNDTFIFDTNHTRNFAQHSWNELQDILILPDEFLREYIVNGVPQRCGFLHETVESHTELANKIYNQVKF